MPISTRIVFNNVVNLCEDLNMSLPSKAQTIGRLGELLYYKKLVDNGKKFKALCLRTGYSECDFIVDGKRVEVKTSIKSNGRFTFSLIKNKNCFDFVLGILLDPIENPIFLKIPASEFDNKVSMAGTRERFNVFVIK